MNTYYDRWCLMILGSLENGDCIVMMTDGEIAFGAEVNVLYVL